MKTPSEAPGCRDAALATLFLLGMGIALFAAGLTLINQVSCDSACETGGLTLLYAGGPVSALFGVFTDSVVVAWPLDVTFWVVTGFLLARRHARVGGGLWGRTVLVIAAALGYGLVLSQFVELAV